MLSKEASSTIFWVFGMTRPGIEPRSPGPLANTLTARPMSGDVLLWTPSHRGASIVRPTRTYLQQLCTDTRCSREDRLEVMGESDKWWERVREIRASNATWWWGYIYIYIYIYTHLPYKYIIIMSRPQHASPWVSPSHFLSLSSIAPGRSFRLHPVSAQSCCI